MERLFDFKNTLDDTPKQVARDFCKKMRPELLKAKKKPLMSDDDFAKVGDAIIAQAAKKAKPVHTNAIKARKNSKRNTAFDMFHMGASAADVAKTLGMTYANAHYYKRAFKKEFS